MTAVFCLLAISSYLGHPDQIHEYFRLLTIALAGTALIYLPIMGWEDRDIAPHRWMLFVSLWIFVAVAVGQVLEHFNNPNFVWYRSPLIFIGSLILMVYIYVRYSRQEL